MKKNQHRQRKRPDYDAVLARIDEFFARPDPVSYTLWLQMIWPWLLAASIAGVALVWAKFTILEMRRNVYNRNRNLKYANENRNLASANLSRASKGRHPRYVKQNQLWRTKSPCRAQSYDRGSRKITLPLPSGFAEGLCKQWDKVRDSYEEMLKFGAMLVELDDCVDNSFVYEGDVIVGRRPGMKGFLRDHCPHIGYTTAMGYRTLALKSREVDDARKLSEICRKCTTLGDLIEAFDAPLKITRRHLSFKRRRTNPRPTTNNPQPAIFSMREEALSATQQLDVQQRERFVSALRELVRELSVS
jgi:hypothetical protein